MKKFLSILLALTLVIGLLPAIGGVAAETTIFTKVSFSDIKATDIVAITSKNASGKYYALGNTNGTNAAPTAVAVTVNGNTMTSTEGDKISWKVSGTTSAFTITHPDNASNKLYGTNSNNGVRVGSNTTNSWSIDTSGYFKITTSGTVRYLGVYNEADWRIYNNYTGNTKDQTFDFWVKTGTGESGNEGGNTETPTPTFTAELVTNVSRLAAGEKYVFVNQTGNYAMGALSGNYFSQVAVSKNNNTVSGTSDPLILTLETGNKTDTWSFKTPDGKYIAATSSSSNNAGTSTSKSNDASWAISIDSDGVASVVAQGTYSRNDLRYNGPSSRFSCYGATTNLEKFKIYIVTEGGESSGGNQGGGSQEPQYTAGTLPTSTNNHYVIWDKTNMKAMSTKYNGYYNMSTTVTLDGTTLKGWGYDDVWEIVKNSDNTYSLLNEEGKKVGMGESYNSHPLDGVNDKWELLTDGTSFYLKNAGRTDNTYYISYSSQHGTWSANTSPVALQITAVTRPEKETLTVKPISDALAAESGDFMVKGVVTFIEMSGSSNYNVYIQDDTGAICVRVAAEGFNIALNNTIIATGTKSYFNGTPQLGSATYEISSGVTVAPAITTISALTKSDICKSVKITGLVVTKIEGDNVTVTDGTNTIKIYKGSYGTEPLCVGDTIDFTGVVGYYNYNAGHTTELNSSKLQLRHNSASELTITAHACDLDNEEFTTDDSQHWKVCSTCKRATSKVNHDDAPNADHKCDVCQKELTKCENCDDDKDHKCNVCDGNVGTHEAATGSHDCDYCGEPVTECADFDDDKDHKCNVCSSNVGTHEAAQGSHNCAYCGKQADNGHVDGNDEGHDCDVCGEENVKGHTDLDDNKICDECGAAMCEGEHSDVKDAEGNDGKDHKCDRCGAAVGGECVAAEGSHACAYCGDVKSECADPDNDHKCDVCAEVLSECKDANTNHECDICKAPMGGECKAAEGKHTCDYCGATKSECSDSATDKDHKCDVCGKDEMNAHDWADATTEAPKTCKICGKTEGEKLPAVSAGATITFDDKSKRDEFDAEKQVWSENGITVTNNKGESTNDVADYAKPARFYKNSSLTIAFNGIKTISFTCNRDSDVTNLVAALTGTDYTVSTNEKVVTVTLKTAANSFSVVLSGGQVRVDAIVINDTTSGDTGNEGGNTGSEGGNTGSEGGNTGNEGGNTGSEGGNTGNEGGNTGNEGGNTGSEGGNTGNEGGNTGNEGTTTPVTKPTVQANPVVGSKYIFGMKQVKKNVTLYFSGEMDGYYLATTEDPAKAVEVQMESVEGGYRMFFMKDGKKTYIDIIPRDNAEGKVNVVLTETPAAVYTYNKDLKTFTTKVVDKEWYLGTYNDFTTFSASETWRITGDNASAADTTQYIAHMYAMTTVSVPSNGDTALSTIVALFVISAMGMVALVAKKKEF